MKLSQSFLPVYAEFPFYGLSRTNVFMFIYTVFLNERSNQFVEPIYRFLCVQLRYRSSNESCKPANCPILRRDAINTNSWFSGTTIISSIRTFHVKLVRNNPPVIIELGLLASIVVITFGEQA